MAEEKVLTPEELELLKKQEREEIERELELDLEYAYEEKNKNNVEEYKTFLHDLRRVELLYERGSSNFQKNNEEIYKIFVKYSSKPEWQHQIGKMIYEEEIRHDRIIYEMNIPMTKSQYTVLKERLSNYDKYNEFAKQLCSEIHFNNSKTAMQFGINEKATLNNVIPSSFARKTGVHYLYPYDNDTLINLINCKKHKLIHSKSKVKDGVLYVQSHYIGTYNNQNVIFAEKIERCETSHKNSYSLGFYINGDHNRYVSLFRADFEPNRNHFNKGIGWYKLNATKNSIKTETYEHYYDSAAKNNAPVYSHLHVNQEFYATMFPHYTQGIDVLYFAPNKVFNNKIEDLPNYLQKNKISSFQSLEDIVNRYSIEQLGDFDNFIYFVRTISGIDAKVNTPQTDIDYNEPVVCDKYIPSMNMVGKNNINISKAYKNYIDKLNGIKVEEENMEETKETIKQTRESISLYEKVLDGKHRSIKDKDATKALEIITQLYPIYENPVKTTDDVFLICSALNLLNAYVKVDMGKAKKVFKEFYASHPEIEEYLKAKKQEFGNTSKLYIDCQNKQDVYKCFKKMVRPLMYRIMESNLEGENVQISPQFDAGQTLAMLQVYGVQFSYHGVPLFPEDTVLNERINNKETWIPWCGVRLQQIACHVFDLGKSLENISENNKKILNNVKKEETEELEMK